MAYQRPAIVSKETRLDKPFFDNLLDGVDEKLSVEVANATYAPALQVAIVVTPEMFGAKGNDPDFDDGPAIQAALDFCDSALVRGGIVKGGGKKYYTGQSLNQGQYTRAQGQARNATQIIANGTFPIGEPIWRCGKPGVMGAIFGSRVEDITFDCAGRAAGWYTRRANEQSGPRNLQVRRAMLYGIKVDNESGDGGQPAQGFVIEHIEINMDLSNVAAPGTGGLVVAGNPGPREIYNVTVNSGDGSTDMAPGIPAFLLDGMQGEVRRTHPEHFSIGYLVGVTRACTGIKINGVGGHSSVSTLVRFTSGLGTTTYAYERLRGGGSAVVVDDQIAGFTSASDVGEYSSGNGVTGQQGVLSTIATVKQRFAAGFQAIGSVSEFIRAATTNQAFIVKLTADANNRLETYANGDMKFGTGGSALTTTLGFAAPFVWGAKAGSALRLDQFTTTARNALSTGWTAPNKTAARGAMVEDTDLGKPIYWDGAAWKDFTGIAV